MPQMSSMDWLMLFIYFLFIYFMVLMIIYFMIYFKKINNDINLNYKVNNYNIIW